MSVDVYTYFQDVIGKYFPQLLNKYENTMSSWRHHMVSDLARDWCAYWLTRDLYLLIAKNLDLTEKPSANSSVVSNTACVLYEIVRLRRRLGARRPRQPVHSYLGAVAKLTTASGDPIGYLADSVLMVMRGMP